MIVLLVAIAARLRPGWVLPGLLFVLPWRVPLFGFVELPTLLVLGAAAGRAPGLVRAAREWPLVGASTLALVAWIAASSLWASSASFALAEAAKWSLVGLSLFVAAADRNAEPPPIVAAVGLGMIPIALWALAERTHLVAPRGDVDELRARLIVLRDLVRGRALFVHPNRLAEFLDQTGVFLAACAAAGPLHRLAAAGVAIALGGSWATGSTAGMAALAGGAILTLAGLSVASLRRTGHRAGARGRWLAGGALLAAAVVGGAAATLAYREHGGLASRRFVYRFAIGLIQEHPILGLGGGNWVLAVAAAPRWMRHNLSFFGPHSHSLVLQLWVELGVIGLALGVAFFAVPLWYGVRAFGRLPAAWRGVEAGAIAGVTALLAHNLVSYFLTQPANGIAPGLLLGLALRGVVGSDVRRS